MEAGTLSLGSALNVCNPGTWYNIKLEIEGTQIERVFKWPITY